MGHDTRFNNHHWGKGGGKVTFEFDAAGIDLDKIAASGQCFRWTPAPGVPGGYIVPTAGLCGTVYTIENRLYIREHTIPDHNNLNPTAIAARGWWGRYLDMGTDYRSRRTDILYWASREPDGYLARAARAGEGMRILNQEPMPPPGETPLCPDSPGEFSRRGVVGLPGTRDPRRREPPPRPRPRIPPPLRCGGGSSGGLGRSRPRSPQADSIRTRPSPIERTSRRGEQGGGLRLPLRSKPWRGFPCGCAYPPRIGAGVPERFPDKPLSRLCRVCATAHFLLRTNERNARGRISRKEIAIP